MSENESQLSLAINYQSLNIYVAHISAGYKDLFGNNLTRISFKWVEKLNVLIVVVTVSVIQLVSFLQEAGIGQVKGSYIMMLMEFLQSLFSIIG